MRRLTLKPNQLIVPAEYEVGKEGILKIYFRVFENGHGSDMPPVIIASPRLSIPHHWSKALRDRDGKVAGSSYLKGEEVEQEFNRRYNQLEQEGAKYYLLDGNHKSIAATLCHEPIPCLELKTDKDVDKARVMVRQGKLFDFPHEYGSLSLIVSKFERHCCSENLERMDTVEDRVRELVSNGDLPEYMIARYRKRRRKRN